MVGHSICQLDWAAERERERERDFREQKQITVNDAVIRLTLAGGCAAAAAAAAQHEREMRVKCAVGLKSALCLLLAARHCYGAADRIEHANTTQSWSLMLLGRRYARR
jgi:hypothetical protein